VGKGSKPRPIKDRKQFNDNWDRIFKGQTQQPKGVDQDKLKEQAQDPKNG